MKKDNSKKRARRKGRMSEKGPNKVYPLTLNDKWERYWAEIQERSVNKATKQQTIEQLEKG